MNFFKLLEVLKPPDAALILYALLDRVPIIVYGNEAVNIDDFIINRTIRIFTGVSLDYGTKPIDEK